MHAPWQSLLLVYRSLDVRLDLGGGERAEFKHRLSEQEVADGLRSFAACPHLLAELSQGEATMTQQVVFAGRPLQSLSVLAGELRWPSPEDTHEEFHRVDRARPCNSLFVLWPQRDIERNRAVPSGGWGLGMGPSARFPGMTYAAVANAPGWAWDVPRVGEVWLHEWLHGVCRIFAAGGCLMPDGDADGGGRHGYTRSATTGWCDFYRDLMTGQVLEDGIRKGITADHWRAWRNRPR